MSLRLVHLYKRWKGMGRSLGIVSAEDLVGVQELLSEAEFQLWSAMAVADQVHSLQVLRIFEHLEPNAQRFDKCAALLHDVAKAISPMSRLARSLATLGSFRRERWRWYRQHEAMGVEALHKVGSSQRTIDLIARSARDAVALSLYKADDSV